MKHKPIETVDDMLSHLREYIADLMIDERNSLMDRISELEEFQRGQYSGAHRALEELHIYIRRLQKHGYEHLRVEDWELTEEKQND